MVGLVGNINLKFKKFSSLDMVMPLKSCCQIKFRLVNCKKSSRRIATDEIEWIIAAYTNSSA